MEHFVALLQATQNGDGILYRRLIHHHWLEPALQSRVLFNILPVLIQGGSANAVQLAPGQHRLEQVAGIHAAFGFARTHDGMQLIDEQNDLSIRLLDFVQHGFQTFLKFAPVFGTGNQCAHIQRENGLILQGLGNILLHNPLGQALGNGGFTNAGLTNEDRVILGLTGQNPHNISDLFVTADHRVHLLFSCPLDQVGAVFFQGVISAFRAV